MSFHSIFSRNQGSNMNVALYEPLGQWITLRFVTKLSKDNAMHIWLVAFTWKTWLLSESARWIYSTKDRDSLFDKRVYELNFT